MSLGIRPQQNLQVFSQSNSDRQELPQINGGRALISANFDAGGPVVVPMGMVSSDALYQIK